MSDGVEIDGLEILAEQLSVPEVLRIVCNTARWVDRKVFLSLPVWYPEFSRKALFYKNNWAEPQLNRNRATGQTVHKAEGNTWANKALTLALGTTKKNRRNWSCCHIWGVDSPLYQMSNSVVQDPRYYSCIANMVLLPTPIKAFTDVMPEVKQALRICAYHYYGWACDHKDLPPWEYLVHRGLPDGYPENWPSDKTPDIAPLGVVPPTDKIWKSIQNRKNRISKDLDGAGDAYPRESVRAVLKYWKIDLQQQGADA